MQFFDNALLRMPKATKDINWVVQYPFLENELNASEKETALGNAVAKYCAAIDRIEGKLDDYCTNNLILYTKLAEGAAAYNYLICGTLMDGNTICMDDRYWTGCRPSCDVSADVDGIERLKSFCDDKDVNFLYVETPYKISKFTDTDIAGHWTLPIQARICFLSSWKRRMSIVLT